MHAHVHHCIMDMMCPPTKCSEKDFNNEQHEVKEDKLAKSNYPTWPSGGNTGNSKSSTKTMVLCGSKVYQIDQCVVLRRKLQEEQKWYKNVTVFHPTPKLLEKGRFRPMAHYTPLSLGPVGYWIQRRRCSLFRAVQNRGLVTMYSMGEHIVIIVPWCTQSCMIPSVLYRSGQGRLRLKGEECS